MKYLCLLFFWGLFTTQILCQDGSLDFAKQLKGSDDQLVLEISNDHEGNIICAGLFRGTTDFDPGIDTFNLTSNGRRDIFVTKLSPEGNFLWAVSAGSSKDEDLNGLDIDLWGNIYLTGAFYNTVDFDPDTSTLNLSSNGKRDAFVWKIDTGGSVLWAKSWGGKETEIGFSIAIDSNGFSYCTGRYSDSVDLDPGVGKAAFYSSSSSAYISKLDSTGSLVIAKSLENGSNNSETLGFFVALNKNEEPLITGTFSMTVDLDPDTSKRTAVSNGVNDIFMIQLNTSLSLVWVKTFGGAGWDQPYGSAFNSGKIYVSGTFNNTVDFDPDIGTFQLSAVGGNSDAFVGKYNSSGSFIWAKQFGDNAFISIPSFTIDKKGSIYMTGSFRDSLDFDPGSNVFRMDSKTNGLFFESDIYVSKLDSGGNFVWARKAGADSTDGAASIAIDNKENLWLGGFFMGAVNFDPGYRNISLTSTGRQDGFIAKFYTCRLYEELKVSDCDSVTSPSGKQVWKTSGIYNDTLKNANGCDTFYKVVVTIKNTFINRKITACDSFKSSFNGYIWHESGTYTDFKPNSNGCKEIWTFDLTILKTTDTLIEVQACSSLTSPSGKYTWVKSGTYMDTLPSTSGCDSIITTKLVLQKSDTNLSVTSCAPYFSPSGKYNWNTSGMYLDTIVNFNGCDSLISINLDILPASNSNIKVYTCDEYKPPSGKHDWTKSGIYYDTISNSMGCDSIIAIELFILKTDSLLTLFKCNQFVSPSGKYVWNKTGIYFDTISNAMGCDSVLTIQLTILGATTSDSITAKACNEYNSPSGKYIWDSSGIYKDTLKNILNCDSVITINLSITSIDKSTHITWNNTTYNTITSNEPVGAYQWLDCNSNYAQIPNATMISYSPLKNGSYAVEVRKNWCIDTSDCRSIFSVNNAYPNNQSDVKIYPNPTKGFIHVELNKEYVKSTINIRAVDGGLMDSYKYENLKSTKIKFTYTKGIYIIELLGSQGVIKTVRIVKI